jgi:predicted RNase H-like HicB family nuclease
MFSFLTSRASDKEIALPFKVVLEGREDGYFLAKVPSLPGCTARGRSKSEALKNIQEAVRLHLEAAASAAFDVVYEDPQHPVLNCAQPFFDRLVAGSSRDGAVVSQSGDYGAWSQGLISGTVLPGEDAFKLKRDALDGPPEASGLVDFTPQAYALAIFAGAGAPKLYAGTSQAGSIYESVDCLHWELSSATGEARVHALHEFKGRLYAGTSAAGKLFCYTGSHWSLIHRSSETAITALCGFKGELFFGTYPGGQIFASADGVNWHLAYDSGQTFVRALCEFNGHLYAATSKASGGMVFRSADGLRWEKVFESRDPNFYCLQAFHHGLWLGTGNHGRLYRTLDGLQWQLAHAIEDEGIRAMASHQGRLFLATEGRGRIYRSRFADTQPPRLHDIRITDISSHSAVVSWKTDRPADSRALYGAEAVLADSVHASHASTEHRVALSYLKSHSKYRLQLISRCPDGSEAGFSEELSFSTGGSELAELSSSSHPGLGAWSKVQDVEMSWLAPEGVNQFHYCLDRMADTLPEPGQKGVKSGSERGARFDGLKDGIWWFHLRCEDRAGNLGSAAAHYALRIDTQALAPKLASTSHPLEGVWSNKSKALFQWEAPTDLSGIKGYYVLLDRKRGSVPTAETGTWTVEAAYHVDLPEDGEWWLHVASLDEAGNVGSEAGHYHLKLDRRADPPSVSSSSHPDPGRWFNTSMLLLSWSPPEDHSGITGYYTLLDQRPETVPTAHSGNFTLATTASYSGKADGLWYFHIVSVDAAGNVGTEATHLTLRVDTWAAPPTVSSPTHPAGTWAASGRAVFELEPPDDLSGVVGYYYALDKDRLSVPSAERGIYSTQRSLEFDGLADGVWTLHVVSKDAAGNVGVEAAHCAVRVDSEAKPPIVGSTTHGNPEDWSRQHSAELVWDAPEDLSGIANYYWLLDREPDTVPTVHSGARTTEQRARVDIPEDGLWYFHCVSQDRAGNVGRQAAHYKLKLDTQALPPRLHSPSHPDKSAWSSQTRPRFEWTEPEDSSGIAGYYWSLDRSPEGSPSPSTAVYTTERHAVLDRGVESDGTWWFHVASRDRVGNVSLEAAHWPVHIDTQAPPPIVRSPSHPDRLAWSNQTQVAFEWDEPEDPSGIAGYFYTFDRSQATVPAEANGTWTQERRAAFAGMEDGVWTLHVVSKDRSGNVGTVAAHCSVRIDTQALPPAVASPTHPEGVWTRNSSPTFIWAPPQDSSGITGYYYLLDREPGSVPGKDNAQFSPNTQASFPRLGDGVWYFHIVSADNAGNMGTRVGHYGIRIDTDARAPKISSSTHPDPDKWSRTAAPQFHWQGPPEPSGISGYYWCVDHHADTVPGPQSQWSTEAQASPGALADGEWYFHVATKDGAGNLSSEAGHYHLRIDATAPKPRVYSRSHPDPSAWSNDLRPSFVWEDDEDLSGIAGHLWSFDPSPNAPVVAGQAIWTTAASVTLPPQKDGVWTFSLVAKDGAGNLSETARLTVRLETGAPVSRLEQLPAASGLPDIELRWRGEDRVSGIAHYDVEVRSGEEGEWKPWLSGTTTTNGSYVGADNQVLSFRVRATDKAGNQEAFSETGPYPSTRIDLSPPEPVLDLDAKPALAGAVSLSWSPVQDSGSGLGHYEVWRYSGPQDPGTLASPAAGVTETRFTDTAKDLHDGALYYYSIVPVDRAGNRRTSGNQRVSCLCDKSALAPVLSSSTHPNPLDWSNTDAAKLEWATPADSTGIAGYYWSLDQALGTLPDPRKADFIEGNELELTGLKDGVWYLHMVSKDLAGNISTEASHYQFNIDTAPPPAPVARCNSHPNPEAWSLERSASFQWSVPPDLAQVAAYYWLVDKQALSVPGPGHGQFSTDTTAQVQGLEDGIWYFHVAATDKAGNNGREAGHVRLQVSHTPPPPKLSSPTHPRAGEIYGSRLAVFHWATPAFSEPIVAWRYCLDQHPDTVPDARNQRSTEQLAEFTGLVDGDWTFHIVSEDASGNLGRLAEHFTVRIRSTLSLQGLVAKPNGILPQEGASLELYRQGKSVAKQSTGREGRFRFDELEPGEYLVKLDAVGLPSLLVDGLNFESGSHTLNLSNEVCAWPQPGPVSGPLRFAVLAREAGQVQIRLFNEAGQSLAQLDAAAQRPGYVKLAWDPSQAEPGQYLWQATHTSGAGKVTKYPIRKLALSRA